MGGHSSVQESPHLGLEETGATLDDDGSWLGGSIQSREVDQLLHPSLLGDAGDPCSSLYMHVIESEVPVIHVSVSS